MNTWKKEDLPEPIKVSTPLPNKKVDNRFVLTDEEVEKFKKQNKEAECPKIIGYERIYEPIADTEIKDDNNAR